MKRLSNAAVEKSASIVCFDEAAANDADLAAMMSGRNAGSNDDGDDNNRDILNRDSGSSWDREAGRNLTNNKPAVVSKMNIDDNDINTSGSNNNDTNLTREKVQGVRKKKASMKAKTECGQDGRIEFVETPKSITLNLEWGAESFSLWTRKDMADQTVKMYYIKFLFTFYPYKWHDRYLKACAHGCPGPIGDMKLHRHVSAHYVQEHKEVRYDEAATDAINAATASKWRNHLTQALVMTPPPLAPLRWKLGLARIKPRRTMVLFSRKVHFDVLRGFKTLYLKFFDDSRPLAYEFIASNQRTVETRPYLSCPLGCRNLKEDSEMFQRGSLKSHFRRIHAGQKCDYEKAKALTRKNWERLYEKDREKYSS